MASMAAAVADAAEATASSATVTVAAEPASTPAAAAGATPAPVYSLTLQPRPSVTWDESVVDNEFHGKKSSKRATRTRPLRPRSALPSPVCAPPLVAMCIDRAC